ncbi:hypothetical protein [Methanosphaerula subterraneus]|uniref:hypothetical protein n=1 Tax=Methanosphaerula subterraneus TaxID=3350244 RepID=UPI003F83E06E
MLPHLLYIPIILTFYYNPRRGLLFAAGLSNCYCAILLTFVTPTTVEMISAIACAGLFLVVAGVVSSWISPSANMQRMHWRLPVKKLNPLSNITLHDFLNQITALKGYIELSQEEQDEQKLAQFMREHGAGGRKSGKTPLGSE